MSAELLVFRGRRTRAVSGGRLVCRIMRRVRVGLVQQDRLLWAILAYKIYHLSRYHCHRSRFLERLDS